VEQWWSQNFVYILYLAPQHASEPPVWRAAVVAVSPLEKIHHIELFEFQVLVKMVVLV